MAAATYIPLRITSTKTNHCTSTICEKQYHEKLPYFSKIYETHARCQYCKIYYPLDKLVDGNRCPCCNHIVRRGPRSKKGKEKWRREKERKKQEKVIKK